MEKVSIANLEAKWIFIADEGVTKVDQVCFGVERIGVDKAKKEANGVDRADGKAWRVDKIGKDLRGDKIGNDRFEEIGIAE